MAKRTASEIYAALVAAGYNPVAAATQTAIALAESKGDDTILGDLSLQGTTWGPSYGVFQVRTLKGQTGTGSVRDISWLAGGLANQAKAAYQISHGGTDFTAWTMYTNGEFQKFLGQAQAAAGGLVGGLAGAIPGAISGAVGNLSGMALAGARSIAVEGVFVVLGLGLLAAGLIRAFGPTYARNSATGTKEALGAVL